MILIFVYLTQLYLANIVIFILVVDKNVVTKTIKQNT